MARTELSAVGASGKPVHLVLDLSDSGEWTLSIDGQPVNAASTVVSLFQTLLHAPQPLDKAQIKYRLWSASTISNATVQNTVTALRRVLSPFFDEPVLRVGSPGKYTLNIGLKPIPVPVRQEPSTWPNQLIVCAEASLCFRVATQMIIGAAKGNKGSGIILPTGRTAGELFHVLLATASERRCAGLEQIKFFIDTETFGVMPTHPTSRNLFVRTALINGLRKAGYTFAEDNFTFFEGVPDPDRHLERYVSALKRTPLILHIISVSPKGEVIGYSPGSHSEEILLHDCNVLTLSEADRRYIDERQPSRSVITIGLVNVLRAERLLIPIVHASKSEILRILFQSDPDPAIPATLLKYHRRTTLITTEALATEAIKDRAIRISRESDIRSKMGIEEL